MYTIKISGADKYKESKLTIDPLTGELGADLVPKSSIAVQAENAALLSAKTAEVKSKVDAYISAKESQGIGNPAPVADFETMKIVNEHGGEFEVVLEEL